MNIHILRICQARLGPGARSTHPDVSGYTIQIATAAVLRETALGLDATLCPLTLEYDCTKISFWMPGSILTTVFPGLVRQFKQQKIIQPTKTYPSVGSIPKFTTIPANILLGSFFILS